LVTIICKRCCHEWQMTITSHIHGKHGFPSCSNCVPWNYDRFLQKAKEVHGNKFYYEKVTPEHIVNNLSNVPIICNDCGYEWSPTIH